MRSYYLMGKEFLCGAMKRIGPNYRWSLYNIVNAPNVTQLFTLKWLIWGSPGGPVVKNLPCNQGPLI